MQAVCHLLTHIVTYCKESLSSCSHYELNFDDPSCDPEAPMEYENMELENFVYEKVNKEMEAKNIANERVSFHNHAPRALVGLVEGWVVFYYLLRIIYFGPPPLPLIMFKIVFMINTLID